MFNGLFQNYWFICVSGAGCWSAGSNHIYWNHSIDHVRVSYKQVAVSHIQFSYQSLNRITISLHVIAYIATHRLIRVCIS